MSCKNKCPLKASRHNDDYTLGYCDGIEQGKADQLKEDCEITISLKGGVLAEHEKQIRDEVIEDIISKIDDEYYDGGYGDYHEVEMIVRMLEKMKGEQNVCN